MTMPIWRRMFCLAVCLAAGLGAGAMAQDKGSLDAAPLPPLANPEDPKLPAKQVFGRAMTPTEAQARSIGFYSRGCLAGAKALPVDGESWQVMRLSRNRNWGNPAMIDFLERFSRKAAKQGVWPGILVGDISQPRGGPMLTGHLSHQIGLDADVWLTPMPDRTLSRAEREEMSAVNMVADDGLGVDRARWSQSQAGVIKAAAAEPEVERIFVNAAIKKALCETSAGAPWMTKVRPYWGHNYHFHIRIRCPAGQDNCQAQEPAPPGDGCDKSLNWWFTDEALHPKIDPNAKPKPPLTLAQMPLECRQVVLEK
jgi:penicillin-insensitive murein endopeptidase